MFLFWNMFLRSAERGEGRKTCCNNKYRVYKFVNNLKQTSTRLCVIVSMGITFLEASSSIPTQEFLQILWNPKD
jgi:hypothetical protein